MYQAFYGLNEAPFTIAPDPKYLFLSQQHQQAINHLQYCLREGGGFVLLTGEVGTGKTTLSRRLLEQLPENTQVAFILNPTLSSQELLATICDELNIRYKKTGLTLKYLTDKIQQKLLKNHEEDINTLLIVDEAQHLQPEVLEQLRLLTNLETNTRKLLQVVLIGQPELQQLLQRRDLRQLAQRITARYHLLPLTRKEVEAYIQHRLTVADCSRPLFNGGAISLIHKISKGIPRLINLLCDRALATAYGNNDSVVNRKTVLTASQQALGSEYHITPWWQKPQVLALSIAANLVIVVGLAYWFGGAGQVTGPDLAQGHELDKTVPVETSNKPVESNSEVDASVNTSEHQATSADQQIAAKTSEASSDDTAGKQTTPSNNTDIGANAELKARIEQLEAKLAQEEASKALRQNEIQTSRAEPLPTNETQSSDSLDFDLSQLEGVSEELLAKFSQAVEETADQQPVKAEQTVQVPSLVDMPVWLQNQVPSMQFEVHIFATDGAGWVRVNGRERYEGDIVAGDVKLESILQDKVILSLNGEQFTLPALSTW
ncbi:MAG: general secretion pathway protein GspA [Colwelliaceae bacterium]|nr:general secretion pathway protein GspA [Colwelliaceae bacterium]